MTDSNATLATSHDAPSYDVPSHDAPSHDTASPGAPGHAPSIFAGGPARPAEPTTRGGTGIVMLNMGGPETLEDVGPFLESLFEDRELLQLPLQDTLGRFIARRRTPKVRGLYEAIGGGSPILRWTEAQGRGMCAQLDRISPETAPHRFYVAFRYTAPSAEQALKAMQADGVERAIAFSQYPQWSCTTSGSSLNDLWRTASRLQMSKAFRWSIIDRWPTHPAFIEAMAETVWEGLEQFEPAVRDDVVLLFSAHSLPIKVIEKGDAYPQEMGASVDRVMKHLGEHRGVRNRFILAYQSEVGPVSWLGPSTEEVIRRFPALGYDKVLVVPIAFTSDHIETLSEIDLEYGELAEEVGLHHFKRAPALNDRPRFIAALAEIVRDHLNAGELHSVQYGLRCAGCENPMCRSLPSPAHPAHPAHATHPAHLAHPSRAAQSATREG
jgi:protoporphyrin/coproporphyrin ferrochelatase